MATAQHKLELPKVPGTIYYPARDGQPAEPVPYFLTDQDVIRLLQLDDNSGGERPDLTLEYYRKRKLLRPVRVGKVNRYPLPEVLAFVDRLGIDQS
jgi:hypothetical protein